MFWGAADDNGAAITGYQYQYQYQYKEGAGDFGDWTVIIDSAPLGKNDLSFTVMGLTNGATYTFRIRAVNNIGPGAATGEKSVTPQGPPPAPTDFSATGGVTSVTLSWTAAVSVSPITKYQYAQDGGAWNDIGNSAPDETNAVSFTVTGLINDNPYTFKLRAVSAIGDGVATGEKTATPRTVPGAPRNVAAAPSDGVALLTWEAPSADGGAPITGYEWGGDNSGGGGWRPVPGGDGDTHSYLVTGLTNATSYTLKVRAVNAAGVGPETAAPAVTPNVPPAAPSGLMATASSSGVRLSWTNPGNSSITGYQVRQSDSVDSAGDRVWGIWEDFTSGASTDFITVSELTHGIEYTFQIRAVNRVGESLESNTVTATLLPAKPVVTGQAGVGQLTLSWPNPNDGTITGYQVQQSTDGGTTWDPAWTAIAGSDKDTTTHTVTGLTNGTAYTFQIRAMQGTASTESDTVTATPLANPAPAFAPDVGIRSVAENLVANTEVGAPVTATDEVGDPLFYSLSGTTFAINSATGQITVGSSTTLDYESSTKSYSVTVSVSDGQDGTANKVTLAVTVTATNVEEATILSGPSAAFYAEDGTAPVASYTAADPEGETIIWTLSGIDIEDFSINGGEVEFRSQPDFGTPADADTDNIYLVTVGAAAGTTAKVTTEVTVTVFTPVATTGNQVVGGVPSGAPTIVTSDDGTLGVGFPGGAVDTSGGFQVLIDPNVEDCGVPVSGRRLTKCVGVTIYGRNGNELAEVALEEAFGSAEIDLVVGNTGSIAVHKREGPGQPWQSIPRCSGSGESERTNASSFPAAPSRCKTSGTLASMR